MTTATLARGPPISVSVDQEDDEDEDALMDEEDVGGQSPGGADEEDARTHGLSIDEADHDMNSDDGGEYSSGDIVDYSGHTTSGLVGHSYSHSRKPAGSSGSLSDGEADSQDNGNGSIQSFDEYHQGDETNGKKCGSGYSSTGGKMNSMSMSAKGVSGSAKNGKNFVCDICMKTFSNAANMRRHRVRHSGIKPFECRFCQKRFFRKDHMREHMNHKHNNTQMECYFCQQVFDKEKDLFQHVTRDHDVNPRELHCQYCSFSATTIGRYLWHMTTSHPRKNSHYIDGSGEPLSMAPYALDEYESPQASPKTTASQTLVGSSSATRVNDSTISYDYLINNKSSKRDYVRERGLSVSPPHSTVASIVQATEHSSAKFRNNSSSSKRFYGDLEVDEAYATPVSGRKPTATASLDAVRYVSILPHKFLPPDTSSQHLAQDLTSYTHPEDLSPFPAKSAFAMLERKVNGNSAFVAAAFAAAAQADSTGKVGGIGGSNRRKSKAPVRMAATPEELQQNGSNSALLASSSVVSSSKRDRDVQSEGAARNGNDSSTSRHFTPVLEEGTSTQPRSGQNNFPEDLSSSSAGQLTGASPSRLSTAGLYPSRSKVVSHNGNESSSTEGVSRTTADQECEQKCPHCLIIYPDNVLYMLHKMLHTKDHPYRCAQCLVQFPNRYEFYAHIVNHGSSNGATH